MLTCQGEQRRQGGGETPLNPEGLNGKQESTAGVGLQSRPGLSLEGQEGKSEEMEMKEPRSGGGRMMGWWGEKVGELGRGWSVKPGPGRQ